MRRKVRDTDDERHEEEKSNDSLRDSGRPRGKRGERVGRWDYMRPFSGSSFGLASEDWLREFDEMRHEMEHVFEETIQDIERIPKDLIREYETAAGGMQEKLVLRFTDILTV